MHHLYQLPDFLVTVSLENYFGCVEDSAGKNIQEMISLGNGLMWNDATVCDGMMDFKISVRYSCEMWKYLERDSAMIFLDPLMF